MQARVILLVLGLSGFVAVAEDAPQARPVQDAELRRELLDRTQTDQEARKALIQWMNEHGSNGLVDESKLSKEKQTEYEKVFARMVRVDADNTKWLKSVVEKHGWPRTSRVGADGAKSAWLLVQHADADAKFQRRCLDLMTALPKSEVSQSNLAYLTDRVLLAEGKKQLYGTQFTSVDGRWQPRPIEDEANVDKRRAAAGLPPLAEYAERMRQQYGGRPKK
jgi:hypothetical protein